METPSRDWITIREVRWYALCPRLFWCRTRVGSGVLPSLEVRGDDARPPQWHTRTWRLRDEVLQLSGRLQVVEFDEAVHCEPSRVMPVCYIEGWSNDDGAMRRPERVALALQVELLRRAGYTCDRIAAWYGRDRTYVRRDVDDGMLDEARDVLRRARACRHRGSDGGPSPREECAHPVCTSERACMEGIEEEAHGDA